MTTLVDGLNLKLHEILNGNNYDTHGHEVTFEKTGALEYSSAYFINCNRKYVIDLSSVFVTVKEVIVPDDDVIYSDVLETGKQTPNIERSSQHHIKSIKKSNRTET